MTTQKKAIAGTRRKPKLKKETLRDLPPRGKGKQIKGGEKLQTTACGKHFPTVIIEI